MMPVSRKRSLVQAFTLAALLAAVPVLSRTTAGIQGSVFDAAGKPVEGATVSMVHQQFGDKVKLETNKKGRFTQIGLKIGDWELTVKKESYPTFVQTIHLALKAKNPIEITLGGRPVAATQPSQTAPVQQQEKQKDQFSLGGVELTEEAAAAYGEAQDALGRGAEDEAMKALENFISLESSLPTPYFMLAQLKRDAGDNQGASGALTKGLELKPDNAEGWLALGEIHSDAGQSSEAASAFQKASEVAPTDPRPLKKLGMARLMAGNYSGAAAAFEKYLELAPDAKDASQKKQLLAECRKLARAE